MVNFCKSHNFCFKTNFLDGTEQYSQRGYHLNYTSEGSYSQLPPSLGSVPSYNNRLPPRISSGVGFNATQLGGDRYSNPQPSQLGGNTYLNSQPQLGSVGMNSNSYSQAPNFNSSSYSNGSDSLPSPYGHPNRSLNPYNVCLF